MNRVPGLSLSALLLALQLQGLLGAGTPGNSSAEGFTPSAATDELHRTKQNRSSALYSSESLSPSQRNILLSLPAETHTAAAGPLGKVPAGASWFTTINLGSLGDLLSCKEKPKQKAGWNYGHTNINWD